MTRPNTNPRPSNEILITLGMRIKEISRTSNLSWSPRGVYPMYLAAGTSAKQLDASFSSSSCLELFEVDPSAKGWEMPVRGSLNVASRWVIKPNIRFGLHVFWDFLNSDELIKMFQVQYHKVGLSWHGVWCYCWWGWQWSNLSVGSSQDSGWRGTAPSCWTT